jgi:signal transduction histidine kinase
MTWSDEVCEIHGVAPGFAPTLEQAIAFHAPEVRERMHALFGQCLAQGTAFDVETQVATPAGGRVWVRTLGEAELDGDGRVLRIHGAMQDISEGQEARLQILRLNAELEERVRQRTAALEAANRELESFSYSIAHDLRAPLSSIDGFSQVLEESAAGVLDGRNLHYLQRIRNAVHHMGELTNGLLALANLSRASLRREPVDLAALARAALDACHQQSPARQVQLVIADTLPAVGDPRLLAQVMGNLVGNAWKFTARTADARIEVGSTQEDGETVFFVRDNGAGFDMAHAGKLFEAFQRLHRQSEFEGTGIGLAIVHRIVGRHGGRIWADAAPDRGACLRFTLPQQH